MSRTEEAITAIEYNRARYRLANAKSENERIQMEAIVRWLGRKLDSYRRNNDTRVQTNEKENSQRGTSDMWTMWRENNQTH